MGKDSGVGCDGDVVISTICLLVVLIMFWKRSKTSYNLIIELLSR